MSPTVASFIVSLQGYDPTEDPDAVATLYPWVEATEEDPTVSKSFEAIFSFFERYPDADLGSPGPLVHLLERHVGLYENLLIASLKRRPAVTTVTMAHRIMNAHRSAEERSLFLALLAHVSESPLSSEVVRSEARHYHEYQTKG